MNFIRYFSNDFHYLFGYDLIVVFLLCIVDVFIIIKSDIAIIVIPFAIGIFMVVERMMNRRRLS